MSDTRIVVYGRDGKPMADLTGCMTTRSWVLNQSGKALFVMPRGNANLTDDILRYGNLITIDNTRTGPWGGFIWTPRNHSFEGVTVNCKSAEAFFSRRTMTQLDLKDSTAGEAFSILLEKINEIEDTRIRSNIIYGGGAVSAISLAPGLVGDAVVSLQRRSSNDWGIDPAIVDDRLVFQASWYKQRGQSWGFALQEGLNIELTQQPVLIEQGDIVNESLAIGGAARNSVAHLATANDATSVAAYGLSQGLAQIQSQSPAYLQSAAQADIEKRRNPRKTWRLTALDVNNTFDYLGLGNTLLLKMASYGLSAQGLGADTSVRIISKEYDDSKGKMVLVVDEVQS